MKNKTAGNSTSRNWRFSGSMKLCASNQVLFWQTLFATEVENLFERDNIFTDHPRKTQNTKNGEIGTECLKKLVLSNFELFPADLNPLRVSQCIDFEGENTFWCFAKFEL